jgi:hypothetical protein
MDTTTIFTAVGTAVAVLTFAYTVRNGQKKRREEDIQARIRQDREQQAILHRLAELEREHEDDDKPST